MKKILSLLIVLAACFSNMMAQTAQGNNVNPVVMNSGKNISPVIKTSDESFTFDDIEFWVGEGANKAALVIQWLDEEEPNSLVWGYRWDGKACGLDIIKAVAKADPRLVLLTQYTGSMGNTICGIGYSDDPFTVEYDLEGAMENGRNAFGFDEPNDFLGQTSVPEDPETDVLKAIEEGLETGVIDHPLNAEIYGYPSYDYDSWSSPDAMHWNAGWYTGYWSYYVKDDQPDDFGYSGLGASSRQLVDGSWDAWMYTSFSSAMPSLSDTFTPATVVSTSINSSTASNAKIIISNNAVRLMNMNGFECNISDMAGRTVKSFTVSGNDRLVNLSLAGGVYVINVTDGVSCINKKFVVK